MDITKLKSDEPMVMSEDMHRAFNAAGCDPACHCCEVKINVGQLYKLGFVASELAQKGNSVSVYDSLKPFKAVIDHEVMLCGSIECTPERMVIDAYKAKEDRDKAYALRSRSGGCSIINGQIVV